MQSFDIHGQPLLFEVAGALLNISIYWILTCPRA
jgi:hypothetical protein